MSESKHTPGPWIFDGDLVWAASIDGYVANTRTEDMTSGENIAKRDALEQIEANARLIAAAPDLLDALKSIVMSAEIGNAAILGPLLVSARAAIAKATGEEV